MTSVAMYNGNTAVALPDQPIGTFDTAEKYRVALAQATQLANSTLVPAAYRGNVGSCFMALEIATRIGASPMMVMQNLHDIKGKPSWSSQFIIAIINGSGKFSTLRWKTVETGSMEIEVTKVTWVNNSKQVSTKKQVFPTYRCYAYAKLLEGGEIIEGPEITTEMAVAEGWFGKPDSKWVTMEKMMHMYRAAAFFGRFYVPEKMLGMHSVEEAEDILAPGPEWVQPTPAGESAVQTPAVDPQRVEFDEGMTSPLWNAKQRDSLVKRYAAADAEGRAALIAAAKKQIAPQEVEVQQAVVVESTPLPQPEPTTGDLFQDDRDLTEEQP
jgi:hypothetical protein